MLGIHDYGLFIVAGILLNLTPGPDTAFVLARSAVGGPRAGAVAGLGIGAGGLVHTAAAALGLSALIVASDLAFTAIKWAGAAYLLLIGVRMLLRRSADVARPQVRPVDAVPVAVFRQAFVTSVFNPKVALFFLAFLPQFIDRDAPSKPLAFALLGLTFVTTGTIYNVAMGLAAGRLSQAVGLSRAGHWLERAMGAVFIALGLRLAWTSR